MIYDLILLRPIQMVVRQLLQRIFVLVGSGAHSTPPKIKSDSKRYDRNVGDDANANVQFYDESASATPANSRGTYNYTIMAKL